MLWSWFLTLLWICSQLLLPGSGKRLQCNHPELINEAHIHYCCKHPDGHNDVTELCAKKTKFKLPSKDEEEEIDVTIDQLVKGSCWAKCFFEEFKFLKNDNLDMDAVRRHYSTVHQDDPEYEREMIAAFDRCHSSTEIAAIKFINSPLLESARTCNPKSMITLACVLYNFFHNCPKSRWANTEECKDTLTFSKKCKGVLMLI